MAKTTKTNEDKKTLTRAEKNVGAQEIVKELLAVKPLKHNELIDEASKLYTERFGSEKEQDVHGVKGRIGSVVSNMEKESVVMEDGGRYALKARMMPTPPPVMQTEEAPVKKTRTRTKKAEAKAEEAPAAAEVKTEEKPVKKTRTRAKKAEEKTEEATPVLPIQPIQPIAPVAPALPETPATEEKPAPKKRGRKPKAVKEAEETKTEAVTEAAQEKTAPETEKTEAKAEESPVEKVEEKPTVKTEEKPAEKPEEKKKEKTELVVKEKGEVAKKPVLMDMSFLFGEPKQKPVEKREEKKAAPAPVKEEKKSAPLKKEEPKAEKQEKQEKPVQKERAAEKPTSAAAPAPVKETRRTPARRASEKPMTADEKLREAYLKKLRSLGGEYFEYYSVYLLERYSMKNGRRLEALRITGGDHDGGIDGEIELTDKLGFRETIYIQSKNWNPEKGKEENWVVGETLLQQFIGACACKQAKDGKQHCRGIFVTTSRFTPDAKRILDDMSEKIVGYDGNDLYEAAKECEFGVVKRNGEWSLDEKLLSGEKAFFRMF